MEKVRVWGGTYRLICGMAASAANVADTGLDVVLELFLERLFNTPTVDHECVCE